MSNFIVNADMSENSSFASKLSKISQLSKIKTVVSSKISEPAKNNIQPVKSSLSKKSLTPIVLNTDISENSSLASNLTKISRLSPKKAVLKSTTHEPEPKYSVLRSVSSSESGVQHIQIAYDSTTNNTNYDAEIASNIYSEASNIYSEASNIYSEASNIYSENSTHKSVHSSAKSNSSASVNKPISTPINTPISTPYIINNSNNLISANLDDITNRVVIDVAVLCQEYTVIETMCHDNIINLDEIPITKDCFQSIFYPYHENFGLNKDFVFYNKFVAPYISFLPEFRRVNNKNFYLLEELISNIERDLNISRNCFTKDSLVELTNEIISIKSLCDVNCCSVLSSLTWTNVLEIIKNYQLINCCQCAYFNTNERETHENYCTTCNTSKLVIIPICVVNIIFKTPTPGVKNTIIRFNYRITDL